ncbi:MAG: tetratricopeptide repeat protein [Burkholderiaceae bacterium]
MSLTRGEKSKPVVAERTPEAGLLAHELTLAGRGDMSITELMASADRYQSQGLAEQSAQLYEQWIRNTQSPYQHVACYNWGAVLGALNRHEQAVEAYRQALSLASGFHQARLNLGHQLEHLGEIEPALEQWRIVWEKRHDTGQPVALDLCLHAVNNLARLLEQQRRLDEAEHYLVTSLELSPAQPDVIQHYVHIRQKQCQWPVYQSVGDITENQLLMGTSALAMLSESDEPAMQLMAASRFVRDKVPVIEEPPLFNADRQPPARLRVGYLSGDFRMHAMGLLIPELLELHDRDKIELFGFCWSSEDGTDLRQRLIRSMDHHIRIGGLSDQEAAELIARCEIDVLVDLQGLSSGARPAILGYRPAPIQVGYLGLPATSAIPGVEYMIADRYVMQPQYLKYCTEKPLFLSGCYQVCDRQREVASPPSRADYDLPEDKFVYCSFNNNHKFSEPVFACWMRTLAAVPDSVLWLLADNATARENMLSCADRHQVGRDRLIFAPRVAPAEYLARFALADLFLDTFPYNAGATASDVLWMGTPILTRSGRTYISRMAGSLLTQVGLPDLITDTLADYEKMAVSLGSNPARAASYKRYLREHGRDSNLFNVPAVVKEIETGFRQLADRRWLQHQSGGSMQ